MKRVKMGVFLLVKKNGMSIFLPADGYWNGGYYNRDTGGYYWTNDGSTIFSFIKSGSSGQLGGYGALGNIYSVRGVCE